MPFTVTNRVIQGGVAESPQLLSAYLDELSVHLGTARTG